MPLTDQITAPIFEFLSDISTMPKIDHYYRQKEIGNMICARHLFRSTAVASLKSIFKINLSSFLH